MATESASRRGRTCPYDPRFKDRDAGSGHGNHTAWYRRRAVCKNNWLRPQAIRPDSPFFCITDVRNSPPRPWVEARICHHESWRSLIHQESVFLPLGRTLGRALSHDGKLPPTGRHPSLVPQALGLIWTRR